MSLSGLLMTKGVAITFTQEAIAYESDTDTPPPPTPVTISGRAMGIGSSIEREPDTDKEMAVQKLAFQPDTLGQVPRKGALTTFAGEKWSVRKADAVRLDGTAMGALIDIER